MDYMAQGKFNPQIGFLIKIGLLGLLILILLIPLMMIQGIIEEREETRLAAEKGITEMWGGRQTLGGPILAVPFHYYVEEKVWEKESYKINRTKVVKEAYFLPEKLAIIGNIDTQTRNLGIYDMTIYNTRLQFAGFFAWPDFTAFQDEGVTRVIDWDEAYLFMELPEMRAIDGPVTLTWNRQSLAFKGDRAAVGLFEGSIRRKVPLQPPAGNVAVNAQQQLSFAFDLALRGSGSLWFLPLGNVTEVDLHSNWAAPGFKGNFLPGERKFGKEGFNAHWNISSIARSFAGRWQTGEVNEQTLLGSQFGVELVIPVTSYTMVTRAVKYGILFILVTFVVFFLFEILAAHRIHFFQYLLVGLALCIFYLLLLSLAEHLGFGLSYLLASLGAIGLITIYAQAILHKPGKTLLVGGLLAGLYLYIYVILQLEDYALLIGSLGLFLILGLIMFVTRRLNWYELKINPFKTRQEETGTE
jgi:inner membrane protein